MQFLVEPAAAARRLPEGATPLPAERAGDLHPSLRNVVAAQPEFAGWVPARLCFLYFGRVEAGGVRMTQKDPRKAPLLALWTVAAPDSAGSPREVAVEIFTSSSRLERPARDAGLDFRSARSTVGKVPEDEEGRPSEDDRYSIRLGKTRITWDGHPAGDSTGASTPVVMAWRAEGRSDDWVEGVLTLAPRSSGGMIGSLKVEGKDDLADMLMQSPIRFVGPGYRGGGASLRIAH
ncbi:MAG TPA: hypothetical protein VFZ26_07360 [Gemmatimonadales bacterium]